MSADDAVYEDSKKRALLATHIDPAWGTEEAFQEVVERYVDEEDYDDFVCISRHEYDDGDFDDRADQVIYSSDGGIAVDEVEPLLDRYDEFVHIGAYWGRCHYQTVRSMAEYIGEQTAGRYRFDVPLEAVAMLETEDAVGDIVLPEVGVFDDLFEELVEDIGSGAYDREEGVLSLLHQRIADDGAGLDQLRRTAVDEFGDYVALLDYMFHDDDVELDLDTEAGLLSWTFTPRKHYDDMIDRFLSRGRYDG